MIWSSLLGAVGKIAPWIWGLLASIIVAALLYWSVHSSGVKEGAATTTSKIEESNNAARKKADRAENRVNDCYNSGGDWDRAHGLCLRRIAPGPGE